MQHRRFARLLERRVAGRPDVRRTELAREREGQVVEARRGPSHLDGERLARLLTCKVSPRLSSMEPSPRTEGAPRRPRCTFRSSATDGRIPSRRGGARAHDRRPQPGAARAAVPARAFPAPADPDARPHRGHPGAVRAVVLHRAVEPARGLRAGRPHEGARAADRRPGDAPSLDHPSGVGEGLLGIRGRDARGPPGRVAPLRQEAALPLRPDLSSQGRPQEADGQRAAPRRAPRSRPQA